MHSTQPKKQARDVFQTILKGRRSWKTLRDGDLVWPPDLEAALLEGMYTPFQRHHLLITDCCAQASRATCPMTRERRGSLDASPGAIGLFPITSSKLLGKREPVSLFLI